jgi:hypothetical protein
MKLKIRINDSSEGWDILTDDSSQDHDGDGAGQWLATVYDPEVLYSIVYFLSLPSFERRTREMLLNEANPVEFSASEYLAAMSYLDNAGVKRTDELGNVLSLVGRIKSIKD